MKSANKLGLFRLNSRSKSVVLLEFAKTAGRLRSQVYLTIFDDFHTNSRRTYFFTRLVFLILPVP